MKRKALILIDIQNDYFPGGANPLKESHEAALNAGKVLKRFRSEGDAVIHIQHISIRKGSQFFLPETTGAEIHEIVHPLDNEKVILKHYPNSFRNTELLSVLKSIEISQLVFCGMMTHMCVDATVRAAKDFAFDSILISDACATKDLEIKDKKIRAQEVHLSFLAALNGFYSEVKTSEEYLQFNQE